jgi:hypothetical protein
VAAKQYGNYLRTAMLNSSYIRTPYGLDNNSSIPFFDKITIYQMARHYWNSYTLVNPLITAFSHDSLDYANSGPSEQSMTLAYETVYYENGYVQQNNPPGFGLDHYDTVPSPISLGGGGTRSLFGAGGVLAGVESVFGSVASGQAFESPENFLATSIRAINTYQNASKLSNTGVKEELNNITRNSLTTASRQRVSGINNARFPISDSNNNTTTQAQPRILNK